MIRARAPTGQALGGPLAPRRSRSPHAVSTRAPRASSPAVRRSRCSVCTRVRSPPRPWRSETRPLPVCHSISSSLQKSPEPSAPTRSPTTDSIRAKLIPGDSDDFRRSYSRWLSPTPRGRPLRIQIKPRRMPEAYLSPPTYLAIPRIQIKSRCMPAAYAAGGATSGISAQTLRLLLVLVGYQ